MPKALKKIQKKILKKKGRACVLHENSRDAQRLRAAQDRDDKLGKIAISRSKIDRPLLERASYFQKALKTYDGKQLGIENIHVLIRRFLDQYNQELNQLKKERRPGRPSSTREDLVRMKASAVEKEYQNGFYMPDLTDEQNVINLNKWEGSWAYLSTLKWVRISSSGKVLTSRFPPKSDA